MRLVEKDLGCALDDGSYVEKNAVASWEKEQIRLRL